MTTISVVIPTLNRRVFLSDAITSLISQNCQNWELIVVDDGSTDDTRRYLEGKSDPRIRFIIRESPGGPSVARNAGLAEARGDLIMFLDDDDLLRPETLATLSEALRAHPEALAATAACRLYTENVGSMKVYHLSRPHTGIIWRELLFGWWANSGQNLYRTDRCPRHRRLRSGALQYAGQKTVARGRDARPRVRASLHGHGIPAAWAADQQEPRNSRPSPDTLGRVHRHVCRLQLGRKRAASDAPQSSSSSQSNPAPIAGSAGPCICNCARVFQRRGWSPLR